MCHAVPRPVTAPAPEFVIAVPKVWLIAGATGHVSGVPFTLAGSCDRKSTATFPGGIPFVGTAGQLVSGWPGVAMRPKAETLKFIPPRETLTFASFGQLFARNTAKQGGLMFA